GLELAPPAWHLALVKTAGLSEVAEAAGLPVNFGQLGQGIDEGDAEPVAGGRVGEERVWKWVDRLEPVDQGHEVEGRSDDRLVVAKGDGTGVGCGRSFEGEEQAVLPRDASPGSLQGDL